ncbi:regulator of G protein signaling domain-containing protein [Cokeromyces recurvatus]|uniref:regulator of G protein signaling domain-containing protein n=1 Tax=Cokeromyces recurvatus TaxID=90255 RepID=UPI00221F7AE9|nr:regulator of G protein signaling domain-containing protein [Cokeromyces recurvatus]KAI7901934.1 regulator of G protein signaling domain-containing protein [Cokeromyces recurvatus]
MDITKLSSNEIKEILLWLHACIYYIQDLHDLFAALIVQIPLDTHRSLFRNYYNTFTSEDAIQALGNLRFSHTVCTPDPNDPSRQQRTTTTTTFNMAREMAKSLCQHFQNCRLMENAVDPQNRTFRDKGIWHLTPKGLCILQDFCLRTEVNISELRKHFSHMEAIQLVRLERNLDDDQLILTRAQVSVIFRVMMVSLPLDGELSSSGNASSVSVSSRQQPCSTPASSTTSSVSSATSSSSPSLSTPFAMSSASSMGDSRVQILGNYLLTLSKSNRTTQVKTAKTMRTVFSSQMCYDWLMDYTTISCREEAESIGQEFIKYNWIEFQDMKHQSIPFKVSKVVMFVVTEKGKKVVLETPKQPISLPPLSQTLSTDRSKSHSEIVRSRSNTIIEEEGGEGEEEEEEKATLQEILSQDPESLLITQSTTTIVNDEDASGNDNNLGQSTLSSNRPSSIAIDHHHSQPADTKESNSARLKIILENAKLRSPFKDFLRANFCEENLDFWIDYNTLRRKCRNQSPALPTQNQKDLMEEVYDIWSTYLAPGSSCELNVEHSLCQEMARIINSVITVIPAYLGQGKPTIVITASSASQSLRMMLKLFDRVNEHICRLMASDSVPKFVKTEKYRKIIDSIERSERKKQRGLEELTDSLRNMDTTDESYHVEIQA